MAWPQIHRRRYRRHRDGRRGRSHGADARSSRARHPRSRRRSLRRRRARPGVQLATTTLRGCSGRRREKVILVANKVESPNSAANIYEFCTLGLMCRCRFRRYTVAERRSARCDRGEAAREKTAPDDDDGIVRLAIIGQPNVGKSSLVNALLGQNARSCRRYPATTRDATDTEIEHDGRRFVIIDTAGIRRHVNQGPALDYYSSLRAVSAIGRCDVALFSSTRKSASPPRIGASRARDRRRQSPRDHGQQVGSCRCRGVRSR